MSRSVISDKNKLIQICVIYRYIALAVSTFVYFLSFGWEITPIRLGIAAGMVSACLIGTYVYKTAFAQSAQIVTIGLEVVANGMFIIVSGGFSSPYLWYFISSLTVVMAAGRVNKRFRMMTPLAVIWCFLCALAGGWAGINIGVAFLVVAGGFYTLFVYVEAYIIIEEQNRIAHEIHDIVIQKLFAVVCSLRLLDEKQDDILAEENRVQLRQIQHAVESTMRELREAIYGLRWKTSEQDKFSDKLASYLNEMECLSGASIELALEGDGESMTPNQKTTLYRIICEAVNNAIRHGKATEVGVRVTLTAEQLGAEIRDNGVGFDQERRSGGRGLKNMHKMTDQFKGQLFVESQIGKGTMIKCALPK